MVYTAQYFRDGYQSRDLAMLDPRKLWNFLAVQIRDKSGPIIVGRPGRGSSSWPFDWFTGYCSTRRTSFFIDTPQNRSSSDRNVSWDPSNSAWASRAIKFSVYKHTVTPRHAAPRIVRTNHHREERFLSKTPSKRLISSKILQNHSTFCHWLSQVPFYLIDTDHSPQNVSSPLRRKHKYAVALFFLIKYL